MEITPETLRQIPTAERRIVERELRRAPPPSEHRVFVYGTLLAGERNAAWARNARRHPAWTRGTIYDTGYGFPAYVRDGETRIVGELLAVDDEGFRSMDRLEGYPRLYRREKIDVYPECGGRVCAWVYIMNSLPPDAKVIASGNWRTRNG
jgi:gamma-glutamylcyclotransferase (GGCT)/AIG2-like uncharacterized protein YtfP